MHVVPIFYYFLWTSTVWTNFIQQFSLDQLEQHLDRMGSTTQSPEWSLPEDKGGWFYRLNSSIALDFLLLASIILFIAATGSCCFYCLERRRKRRGVTRPPSDSAFDLYLRQQSQISPAQQKLFSLHSSIRTSPIHHSPHSPLERAGPFS